MQQPIMTVPLSGEPPSPRRLGLGAGVIETIMPARVGLVAFAAMLCLGLPSEVFAYVGPGAGLTVIGAALAFIVTVVLAFAGFIWYPIKCLLKARSRKVGAAK